MPVEQPSLRRLRLAFPWGPALAWTIAVVVVSLLVWFKPNSRTVYTIYAHAGRGWLKGHPRPFSGCWRLERGAIPAAQGFCRQGQSVDGLNQSR